MPLVDDGWPGYWEQVDEGTGKVGSSRAVYLTLDHDHVVDWFKRYWDLLEPLVDDPELGHVRFATFDGNQLRCRFRVIGLLPLGLPALGFAAGRLTACAVGGVVMPASCD